MSLNFDLGDLFCVLEFRVLQLERNLAGLDGGEIIMIGGIILITFNVFLKVLNV